MQEMQALSLGWEDPLEKGKATHSSIPAWRIPWALYSMELQRVGQDWATFTVNSFIIKIIILKENVFVHLENAYA